MHLIGTLLGLEVPGRWRLGGGLRDGHVAPAWQRAGGHAHTQPRVVVMKPAAKESICAKDLEMPCFLYDAMFLSAVVLVPRASRLSGCYGWRAFKSRWAHERAGPLA
eukprot:364550-Chlamydomonas_euryale.AAC.7